MSLANKVFVERRFQRSIRIDTDLHDDAALKGFVCPESSASVLVNLSNHIVEGEQAAFTWTGPYGSGKSSLVIALSALTSPSDSRRQAAEKSVGTEHAKKICEAFAVTDKGWLTIPVVGERASTHTAVGEALINHGVANKTPKNGWTDRSLVRALLDAANDSSDKDGIILFIDEMGKFLEAAARDGEDIYLFQQLAEAAARSKGKLVVIGILHQSFAEYANRLSRDIRDEWSKIQGRFVDLVVNTAGEEQIDLLSRAIQSKHKPKKLTQRSRVVAEAIRKEKPGVSENIENLLDGTWPLHPASAALLGPISRRSFGQNQRSLFGFLNSAEPYGFQSFLEAAKENEVYKPSLLWDYLKVNLEPSIIASSDGHRWAIAAEAIDRCEASGALELHVDLLKSIAVLDLFRQASGVTANRDVIFTFVYEAQSKIDDALEYLLENSFVIFRKYLSGFAVFAGSDFDIETALEEAVSGLKGINFSDLKAMAALQPILAKRHYFQTGTQRLFNLEIAPLNDIREIVSGFEMQPSIIGLYLLALPTENEDSSIIEEECKLASLEATKAELNVVVGYPQQAWKIVELVKELQALEFIKERYPEIQGDQVAQREISIREVFLRNNLEIELQQAVLQTTWFDWGVRLENISAQELNNKVSDLADRLFPHSPKLKNELMNRNKPSGSAVGGQNALLRAMAVNIGEPRLGIEGYPVEGGLFESLLGSTGLYREINGVYDFCAPTPQFDPANLFFMWKEASEYLEKNSDRAVPLSELYEIWQSGKIGLRPGLMPILGLAFVLSKRHELAFYRESIFLPQFTDLEADYLSKDPNSIQVRWMDLSGISKQLLSGLADVVRELDPSNSLTELAPIDVARGVIAIFDTLPNWTKRTRNLSSVAIKFRTIFKEAYDPNQLLFSDLPNAYKKDADIKDDKIALGIVELTRQVLKELVEAYPKMLERILNLLQTELKVPNFSPQSLSDLRARAENIKQISGDFRLDAFSNRLAVFDGTELAIEGIGSLAANKPPRDWVDADLNKALIEVAEMAQKFIKTETFAHVQGKETKRETVTVIVNQGGRLQPFEANFNVSEQEQEQVDGLIKQLKSSLDNKDLTAQILLSAFARLSSEIMQPVNIGAETKN